MKKNLAFVSALLILSLFACQKEDDTSQIETIDNPVTGYWIPLETVKVYENNEIVKKVFDDCGTAIPSHIYFHNTIQKDFFQVYREKINQDSCFYIAGNGKWHSIDQNTYGIEIEYFPESDYKSSLVENLIYKIDFFNNDSIHLHDQNKLANLQTEESNLIDIYQVLKYRENLFD